MRISQNIRIIIVNWLKRGGFSACLMILGLVSSFGQKVSIVGIIQDNSTEPVSNVLVFDSLQMQVTESDETGAFRIDVLSGLPVFIQHVGFQTVRIVAHADTNIAIELMPLNLDEILIETAAPLQSQKAGFIGVNREIVKSLPSIGGEVDFVYALALYPGVSLGEEISKGISIRGGSLDQTLTYIEGVRSSNTGHLFNLFSVVNAAAVERVGLYKGGLPGQYGNILSGTIDISLLEPDKNSFEFDIGLINSKATMARVTNKEKMPIRYVISARSSYIDLFRQNQLERAENNFEPLGVNSGSDLYVGYTFYDVLGSVTMNLSPSLKWKTFGIMAYDKNTYIFNENIIDDLSHQLFNHTFGTALTKRFSAQSELKFTAGYNYHKIDRKEANLEFQSDILTERTDLRHIYGVDNTTLRLDYKGQIEKVDISAGLFTHIRENRPSDGSVNEFTFDPILRESNTEVVLAENETFSTLLSGLYVNTDFNLTRKLNLFSSLRYSYFSTDPDAVQALEPRVLLTHKLGKTSHISTSLDYLSQFDHGLLLSDVGLDNLIFLPTFDQIKVGRSLNLAIEGSYNIKAVNLALTHSLFYKDQKNIQELALIDQNDIVGGDLFEFVAVNGTGEIYGLETQVTYQKEPFVINLSYTYSRSERQFSQLNGGLDYPYRYDKPHELSISGLWHLSANSSFSVNWQWYNGSRYTLPSTEVNSLFEAGDKTIVFYHNRNGSQLPNYHRLDISFNTGIKLFENWESNLTFNVLNTYNFRNPNFTELNDELPNLTRLFAVSYIPILPSINLKLRRE